MASSEFRLGFQEARNGIPFDWRNGAWEYERGRLFAHLAPLNMPLRVGQQINPKAVTLLEAAFKRKLVI